MGVKQVAVYVVVLMVIFPDCCRLGRALGAEKVTARPVSSPVQIFKGNNAANVRPPERDTLRRIQRRVNTVNFSALTCDTTFGQAIEILRHSTDPPLNIIVLWRDLWENASVNESTPILMDGVSGIPLGMALELVLMAVSSQPGRLGYTVQGGVIIIATRAALPVRRIIRVYDITDLVAPANYGLLPVFGFGGIGPLVRNTIQPNSWR